MQDRESTGETVPADTGRPPACFGDVRQARDENLFGPVGTALACPLLGGVIVCGASMSVPGYPLSPSEGLTVLIASPLPGVVLAAAAYGLVPPSSRRSFLRLAAALSAVFPCMAAVSLAYPQWRVEAVAAVTVATVSVFGALYALLSRILSLPGAVARNLIVITAVAAAALLSAGQAVSGPASRAGRGGGSPAVARPSRGTPVPQGDDGAEHAYDEDRRFRAMSSAEYCACSEAVESYCAAVRDGDGPGARELLREVDARLHPGGGRSCPAGPRPGQTVLFRSECCDPRDGVSRGVIVDAAGAVRPYAVPSAECGRATEKVLLERLAGQAGAPAFHIGRDELRRRYAQTLAAAGGGNDGRDPGGIRFYGYTADPATGETRCVLLENCRKEAAAASVCAWLEDVAGRCPEIR